MQSTAGAEKRIELQIRPSYQKETGGYLIITLPIIIRLNVKLPISLRIAVVLILGGPIRIGKVLNLIILLFTLHGHYVKMDTRQLQ